MKHFPKKIILLIALIIALLTSGCDMLDDNAQSNSSANTKAYSDDSSFDTTVEETTLEETTIAETTIVETTKTATAQNKKKVKVKIKHASSKLKLSSIPKYKAVRTPYVKVNGNKPTFKKKEIKRVSFQKYSKLDSKGRCGVAIASIARDIMPKSKRTSISEVHPSGWHSYRYSNVEGQSLYNRCHLIGHQLTGQNANAKNLITGTRYLNTQGMLPFENEVADYVRRTNNHVMYRVRPVYKGDNLVASGVQMEAYSVEDKGRGVSFNVYCYNVQPGVKIHYSDGTSSGKHMISSNWSSKPNTHNKKKYKVVNKKKSGSKTYILSLGTKKFHYPDCPSVNQILPKNKGKFKGNRKTLINQGYAPCKNCNP